MNTWAQNLIDFYTNLNPPKKLPNGITWLHPQQSGEVVEISTSFFQKFFNDTAPRRLLLGINPGRFGAGVTGVNFTAPKQLTHDCGIEHHLRMQSELSAEFIYDVINGYGGPQKFYKHFFIGSVCPLGFVKGGKNINYYDDKELLQTVKPFILQNLKKLLSFPVITDTCLCIGGEKNYKFLVALNEEHGFFKKVIPLPHPRFILQYRRREREVYLQQYLDALEN
jgi:Domain of unknown function (DUF4918)